MASKVQRYVCVGSPESTVVHRLFSKLMVEGEKTACGIHVQRGWPYGQKKDFASRAVCQRCENAHVA